MQTRNTNVLKHITSKAPALSSDVVVVEEPLVVALKTTTHDMQLETIVVMTTMRTPGNDIELVKGWLNTQQFISKLDILSIKNEHDNLVSISTTRSFHLDKTKLTRLSTVTSSCGICGDAQIDDLALLSAVTPLSELMLDPNILRHNVKTAFESAQLFVKTGSSHSSAAFLLDDATLTNKLVALREDVGRHNALDKLIGSLKLEQLRCIALLLSGRVSGDLMQKVICAGIPVVIAIGAPSSLAIEMADSSGVILIGFVKATGFNVYSGETRLKTLT